MQELAPDRAVLRLAAQHAVVRALAESSTLAEATQRILEAIGQTLGWKLGALWEVDEREEVLRWVGSWVSSDIDAQEFERRSRDIEFRCGHGLPGRAWADAKPIWVSDMPESSLPRASVAEEVGLRAGVCFPIHGSNGVLGVIEFFAREARPPEPEVLELVTTFGRQIGQYMERTRAYDAVRRSEALKSAILDSALDCVITMDHRGRVVEFNPAAVRTFGYRRDQVTGHEMAGLIIPPAYRDTHRRALAKYLATGEGPILDKHLELTGMRSDGSEFPVELTVTRIRGSDPPMFTGYIRDITERKRTEEDRTALLEREHAARLQAERAERRSARIARTLQQSLLPPNLPQIPGIEAASLFRAAGEGNDVGGDFYDVFYTGDGRWAIVIGDVVGKGPEAAALTALARYTLRAAAMQERQPSQVLAILNEALLLQSEPNDFCTVIYACLETVDGQACVTAAIGGHPLPLVARATGVVESAGRPGTLIGVLPQLELEDERVALDYGDALVLYTDGVTEARTPRGMQGVEGLASVLEGAAGLSAAELVRRIELGAIDAPGHLISDDVAILVLRRSPEGG